MNTPNMLDFAPPPDDIGALAEVLLHACGCTGPADALARLTVAASVAERHARRTWSDPRTATVLQNAALLLGDALGQTVCAWEVIHETVTREED